jgi:hypothetical protein
MKRTRAEMLLFSPSTAAFWCNMLARRQAIRGEGAMAEAERVPTITAPSGAPLNSATHAEPPHQPSNWGHWELLALAALGATFGFLTGLGLYGEVHNDLRAFILQAAILGLAAYVLFDPAMELLHDVLGAKRDEFPEDRKFFAAMLVAFATVVLSAFHHSLGDTLGRELGALAQPLNAVDGLAFAVFVFGCIGTTAFAVTYAWVLGARRNPRRAARYGAVVGAIGGLTVTLVVFLVVRFHYQYPAGPWLLAVFLLALLWFCGSGFLGGRVIDRRHLLLGPTRRILGSFVLLSVVGGLLLLAAAHAWVLASQGSDSSADSLVFPLVAVLVLQNLGWAAGPYFRRKSCDVHLDPSVAPEEKPSPQRRLAPMVVFPGQGAASSPAVATVDDKRTPTARAQDLLLKPKGDRLWAAVALVLALVTGAVAFYAGSLRRDPEILISIGQRFQQDSGLHKRPLTVRSTDRIVTISGAVDDEAEHAKAVQEALSVRGVKQLIDQIQVAPALSQLPTLSAPAVPVPDRKPPAAVNVAVPVVTPQASEPAGAATPKSDATAKASNTKKPGFFHRLFKGNDQSDKNQTDKNQKNKTKPNTKLKTKNAPTR